ncbi:MAG: polysaccharide deacetylase family protein [Myxococcota bacterium]
MTSDASLIERLGFARGDRVIVVHVDDMGLCSAANRGALRALGGAATSASVMVPCPAFEEVAELARARPELDLGVHLTLNAEHEVLRWGPVLDDVPSLVSPDGGMWRSTAEVVAHARPDEVERELRAQVERALAAGIDVTHLDAHMGTVFDLAFVQSYVRLGRELRVPLFIPRLDVEVLRARGLADRLAPYLELIEEVEAEGFPLFDHFDQNSLHFEPGHGLQHNRERVAGLGPGLSYLITHCAEGGSELESVTVDWRQRDEEHRIYSDGQMAAVLQEPGVHTIGMRALRDLLRAG